MKIKTFIKKIPLSKKRLKKIWANLIFRKIILASGLLVLTLATVFFIFNLAYADQVFPRTFIGRTNFGGMDRKQAQKVLEELMAQSQNASVDFSWQEKNYNADIAVLEVDFSAKKEKTLDDLLAVGRVGFLGKIIKENFKAIFSQNRVLAAFDINESKVGDYLSHIAQELDRPEKDATLEIRDGQPVVVAEDIGQKFEILENKKILKENIGQFNFPPSMPFRVSQMLPKIDSQTAEIAIPETRELLNRQLVLEAAGKTFQLYPQDIAGMLEFVARLNFNPLDGKSAQGVVNPYKLSPEISVQKLYPFVEKIASEVYQEPKDPQFKVSGGRVKAFQLAQTGYELEKEKAVSQIIEALKSGKNSLELPVKVTESAISSDDPAEIGLKELVAEGTTNFSGSPQNRRHNIAVGANTFNGILIKPGEEFSMLKYLGPVEASTGYLPELVIKEDRTIPEYGGGLCQVSTTMFRAALNVGLKITERQNHSYRVRYYEPPVGMDATIYIPKPDLRFVNDYDNYLLIQTVISGDNLTFQFYGTRDGRRSETTEPYVYDVTGSGEPIYTESPDLAPGEIKRIETAHPGSKASFKYSVFDKNNNLMHEETFNSSYVPWPARYLYGPGTTIPPPEGE